MVWQEARVNGTAGKAGVNGRAVVNGRAGGKVEK
jgi:hypothetical protein